MGISNPALDNVDLVEQQIDSGKSSTVQQEDETDDTSGCFSRGPMSPDSEYDETLAFPDSVTILSMGGDKPILIERKEDDGESMIVETDIPFLNVYRSPIKFKSIHRKVFIPGVEIQVHIIENERSITTHLLNPNL